MIKVLDLQLGFSDFYEDYSYENPKYYGGGPTFARSAREIWNNTDSDIEFWQLGHEQNFVNLTNNERKDRCIAAPSETLAAIRSGYPISQVIDIDYFDIVIYNHTCWKLNMAGINKCKEVFWSGFGTVDASAGQPYILLYDPDEYEKYKNYKGVYKIVIGKPVPKFEYRTKEDFIFSCQRNDELQNTIEVAQQCLKYGIKGIFAGRIWPNYNLLDFIDNKTTFYIGDRVSEKEKIDYTSRAIMTCYPHKWETAFNLSAIESLGVNTPILANPTRAFKYLVKENENGWFYTGENFEESFHKAKSLDQQKIYNSSLNYSDLAMLDSFKKVFENILFNK